MQCKNRKRTSIPRQLVKMIGKINNKARSVVMALKILDRLLHPYKLGGSNAGGSTKNGKQPGSPLRAVFPPKQALALTGPQKS